MKIIELHFMGCRYMDDFHERLRVAFNFPEWYGKNWSAFWDLLWSECDADKVIIRGEQDLSADFSEHILKLHEIFERNRQFRKQNGLTPFDYEVID